MDLITTHINADFDALGSLIAAKKLYPNSRLLLPGSQERSVREFLALSKDLIIFESEKECDLDNIDRVILVDTRHKWRIGVASQLVDKRVEVHIYDHHPRMREDIVADKDVYEEVGATITILTELIKKKRLRLSPLESTILLLGIYEETGSLTYRTTTKSDVDMVSFLLSQGANLSIVSSYLNRELSEEELSFLTKLINATERTFVKGINVSMIEIEAEDYVGELGLLIHKLLEIENIPALFVFIKSKTGRVNIIARSKISNVDVNKVLSHFGGGGHTSAASAKIQSGDIASLKEKLIRVLKSHIKIRLYAKDIMSKDVKTVSSNQTIDETKRILLKEKMGGIIVADKGRIAGIITLAGLNKAIRHGFGHSRVKGYMSRKVLTVSEGTPLYAMHKMIIEKEAGILPVVKGKEIIGVINRTDVLRKVYNGFFAKKVEAGVKKIVLNLSKKMTGVFPKEILNLLKRIGSSSNKLGFSAFVVGGLVRDLLLGVRNLDLDIVMEGDAISFGKALSQRLHGALVVHRRFGTCTVVTKDRLKIDLATARKEVYEKPAALPTVVEFGSLKNDLIRRDFTINAMAISLNKKNFGQLIDFFDGEEDLARGRIRVMHDGSFIDDPTRIFRAVRFEQRFGFTIDSRTEELILNAMEEEMFEKVEPQRIRDEIELILKEREPIRALNRMTELHELRFIHPKIILTQEIRRFYDSIDKLSLWYERSHFRKRGIEKWLMYLMALFEPLTYKEAQDICDKFVFRRGERLRILSYKKNSENTIKVLSVRKGLSPSRVYEMLEPLSFEVILLIMAKSNSKLLRSRVKAFFEKYNGIRIKIRGEDIKRLGLRPGPKFKMILNKVLHKKIDGVLKTKRDELEYVKELLVRI